MEEELELSQQLVGHEAAVRCLAILRDNRIVSGGLDKQINVWKLVDTVFMKENTLLHHEDFVYALCASADGGFYSGGKDKAIYRLDTSGNPVAQFVGHDGAVCSLAEAADLLSGSWDGTVKVWDLTTNAVKYSLDAGAHASCCGMLPNGEVVTGSQTKVLRFWRGDAMLREVEAHEDIIRGLAPHATGFYSCSNDNLIKSWSLDGAQMGAFVGHTGFVFAVTHAADRIISAGDDRTLRVWNAEGECKHSKLHCGTVWACGVLANGDLVSASDDGVVRIWTSAPARFAPIEERQTQKEAADLAAVKDADKGASAVSTEGVPDVSEMATTAGQREGEVKMFKDGGKVMAYSWSGGTWQLIGEVTGQSAKSQFEGDDYFPAGEYDFVFDVELGGDSEAGGGRTAKLPYNKGQNPMVAARAFICREGISQAHLMQVMKFIENSSGGGGGPPTLGGGAPKAAPKPTPPPTQTSGYAGQGQVKWKHFPVQQAVLFRDGKLDAIESKLVEFNEAVGDLKLDALSISYLPDLMRSLKKGPGSTIRECDKDVLKLLCKWPLDKLFPVIDLMRLFLLHPASGDLFKGSDRGLGQITESLCWLSDVNAPAALCGMRFFANCFASQTNSFPVYEQRQLLCQRFEPVVKSTNKNTRLALATVLLNFAVTSMSRKEKVLDCACVVDLLVKHLAAEGEAEARYRLLAALGTFVVRDRTLAAQVVSKISSLSFPPGREADALAELKQACA